MISTPLEFNKRLESMKKELKGLKKEALAEFKDLTPIRTGNARRNTYLQGNTIEANYPYAGKLDEGYSKQAPKGMTEPFEKWFSKRVKQILKGKG